jgi:hypothetical protein
MPEYWEDWLTRHPGRFLRWTALVLLVALMAPGPRASAQAPASDPLRNWSTEQTTVIPAPEQTAELFVTAHLTSESPPLSHGVIWRVYQPTEEGPKFLEASRAPSATFNLPPGRYIVNAAYGMAHLTRAIELEGGQQLSERFVINAGGLKVFAKMGNGSDVPEGSVSYDVYSDDREPSGERLRILANAKPGAVIRLNSGIYQIISTMGDANAFIRAEVTVEAGKLTEATFAHDAGKCTFKLVSEPGGEAIAGVRWVILGLNGNVIKESAGALPTHILAPGDYSVSARFNNQLYTRTFSVRSGETNEIEVLLQ